jgi:hypothetical protein
MDSDCERVTAIRIGPVRETWDSIIKRVIFRPHRAIGDRGVEISNVRTYFSIEICFY